MFDLSIVLYEYTEILMGVRRNYSVNFFESGNKEKDEDNIVRFVRLAVKIFLRCRSPEAAAATVTPTLLKTLKLHTIVNHIQVPRYVLPQEKDQYRLDRIFQDDFNKEQWIAFHLCEGILNGTVSKYPKYYMNDYEGYERAKYCLSYFLQKLLPLYRVVDLYRFSATPEFNSFLRNRLLQNVRMKMFDSPVEYLHESLPPECQNEAYYHMYEALYQVNNRYYSRRYPEIEDPDPMVSIRVACRKEKAGKKAKGENNACEK